MARSLLNIRTDNLTTVFTGVCSACLIGILSFLWYLKEKVPEAVRGLERVEKKQDAMQGSINSLSERFTLLSTEQARQQGKIDNLNEKIDKKGK